MLKHDLNLAQLVARAAAAGFPQFATVEHDLSGTGRPTYLPFVSDENEVLGCARLLPTTGPNMLADTFANLMGNRTSRSEAAMPANAGGRNHIGRSGQRFASPLDRRTGRQSAVAAEVIASSSQS
ncbi:acyl-homoserine-lactone synthase [Bradyrhizobium sp. CB82]|uniref:acyl-homoserine-lactone synthase n=1 Tax=Bradyrhizobium sp. CB82 TaxID=3039159 RepID=UPI0024B213C1|nr:acyl-homoserine-lactone synthase [Bradyrhizobium sp. CB82]WFU44394.1 acyl-homoserine-lactone synthase [Bradyrhizobium sp. CB82]